MVKTSKTIGNTQDVRKFKDKNQNPVEANSNIEYLNNTNCSSSKTTFDNKDLKENKSTKIIDDKVLETLKQQKLSSNPIGKLSEIANQQAKCTIKKEINGYVGFSNYFSQKERRKRKELSLNIVILGEIGVGKTTFIKTLLSDGEDNLKVSHHKTYLKYHSSLNYPDHKLKINVIEFNKGKRSEFLIKFLKLFIVSLGYGDVINNSEVWDPAIKYLEQNLEEHFEQEMKVKLFIFMIFVLLLKLQAVRTAAVKDIGPDVCIYMIPPTGHGAKRSDIECLKRFQVINHQSD